MAEVRVLDPACGSGNFLIVAYRELRQLELNILLRLQELGDTSALSTLYFERDDLAVQLNHIAGIEIEEWPAHIAKTAIRLTDHQANMAMELALGKAPETLPLDTIAIVHVGNALRMDWETVMHATNGVRVAGNPPFIGQKEKTRDQANDLKLVWGKNYDGYLDYVTGWYKKASDYLEDTPGGRFAFVSTNSISQGQPVSALFGPLFESGWRISFAHQTFAWTSEAPKAANVHCVIVGFDKNLENSAQIFTYATLKGVPTVQTAKNVNAYLLDAPNLLVTKRMAPLSRDLVPVRSGSTAFDWGYLTIDDAPDGPNFQAVNVDPIAKKYLRLYIGGEELINGIERWCLWLPEVTHSDIQNSHELLSRVEKVQELRSASKRAGTLKAAQTPTLFGEDRQPSSSYLGIPQTFSERRKYATVGRLPADVIANKKLFTADDPDGFLFAIVSSSMFITWQKTIGGRLKSDPSFSNTLVWNNLPLPSVSESLRLEIIDAGKGVLDARHRFRGRSLAELYNPLTMKPELLKAHANLDGVVDRAFGATKQLRSNEERVPILFQRYLELTRDQK